MPLNTDWGNKILQVTAPDTEVSGQVLHNFIEDQMASPEGMVNDGAAPFFGDIIVPEGKIEDPNNPGVYSLIILKLSFEWQIQFWRGSGYTRIYGAKIVGGVNNQPFKATGAAGDITVLESPVDGLTVATGSGVTEQDKDDIAAKTVVAGNLDYIRHTVFVDTERFPEVGNGSELTPFGVTSNAIDFAELKGFTHISLMSNLDVDRDIHNFLFCGGGGTPIIDTGSFNLDKCEFEHVALTGLFDGRIIAQDSNVIGNNTNINGFYENCAFGERFEVPNNGVAFIKNCASLVSGFTKTVMSVGGLAGTAELVVMGHNGGITVEHCNQPTDEVKIISTGIVELDNTCIDGIIVVLGIIRPIDNSGPGCTVLWYNINPEELADVWDANYNKRDRNDVTNIIDLYNRDGTSIKKQFQSDADYNLVDPI